jgi:hypothetical protein
MVKKLFNVFPSCNELLTCAEFELILKICGGDVCCHVLFKIK